ncbi:hypothetical protein K2Y11_22650 [bacterium]|nr:hypothetical protein [bacterium]
MKEWLTNARAGSPEDLGRLMHTCRTYLFLVANQELDQSLLAKGGASDLVQETYKHALEGFGSFKGDSAKELRSWLRTILRNHLSNLRRTICVASTSERNGVIRRKRFPLRPSSIWIRERWRYVRVSRPARSG